MAAGMGSRYGGLKQLDQVGPSGETILEYSLYDALLAGFKKVVFVIRKDFESEFRSRFKRWESNLDMRFVYQDVNPELPWMKNPIQREKPWGTGHAVLVASREIQGPFAVINADDFYGRDAFTQIAGFLKTTCTQTHYGLVSFLLGRTLSPHGPVSRGVCSFDKKNSLLGIAEIQGIQILNGSFVNDTEPSRKLSTSTPVSMNFWAFHPSIFKTLEKDFQSFTLENTLNAKAEFLLPTHIFDLLKTDKIQVSGFSSAEYWYGITYRQDRDHVHAALDKMVQAGFYPSPLI